MAVLEPYDFELDVPQTPNMIAEKIVKWIISWKTKKNILLTLWRMLSQLKVFLLPASFDLERGWKFGEWKNPMFICYRWRQPTNSEDGITSEYMKDHTIFGYIANSQSDQLPVGMIAQLVEHCTGIARWLNTVFDTCVSFTFFSKSLDLSVAKNGSKQVNNTNFDFFMVRLTYVPLPWQHE